MKQIKYYDSSEDILLNLFSNKPETQLSFEIEKILLNPPDWPTFYHLSPQRKNILEWFPFKKESTLLEIGAGCGAITRLLCQKVKVVHALELEEKRAEIIRRRLKDKKNIKVLQTDFNNFIENTKYDYITLIGVLEYAGRFFGKYHKNLKYNYEPFTEMLKKAYSLLKPGGKLFIAIENKLGTRYFTGCTEDHYDIFGESIEDYPDYNGIRTFSKSELNKMLSLAGFRNKANYYYPFPDYKLPNLIYTDKTIKMITPASIFPSHDYAKSRSYGINEVMFANTLLKSEIFNQFTNSLLIEISK